MPVLKDYKLIIMPLKKAHVRYNYAFAYILAILFLFFSSSTQAQKDFVNPIADFQTVRAGSYVIPMDTIYQSIVPAGMAPFNLQAYGLVNEFLQNGIPVRWAIAADKDINDIDFTALAERIAPSYIPPSVISFRGGPFIVPDTVLPCGQSTAQIISSYGKNVAIYRLPATISVDIRYTITHRPKIAVFNNGGNELIHTKILDAAGIENYDVMDAARINDLMNCYTFASEPHADSSQVSMDMINGVRAFVMRGGNFLAQCHAIDTYENRGFFHTTAGIIDVNVNVSHLYPNADLAFSQLHGSLQENEGGSVHNWTLKNGSSWLPTTYQSVSHIGADTVIAMGAHLLPPSAAGGNVYYLGGHDYSKGGKGKANPVPDLTKLARVNALRMYLNAVFVPSENTNGAWANAGAPVLNIGCSESVVLGCEPTGPPGSTFLWTPSTGLSCSDCPNPVASPVVNTRYVVTVTHRCVAKDTVDVLVSPKPLSQYTNTTVCQGVSTSFTDQSINSNFWQWNFGDPASGTNNTSSLQNPTHVFSSAGSFSVTLISGIIPCLDTIVQTVVVNPLPVLTVSSDTICAGQTTTLTASGATSYSWSSGQLVNSITVNPASTTSYTVTGSIGSCSASIISTVTVIPPIVPTVLPTHVSCFGGADGTASVSVTGGKPGFTYSWNTIPSQTTAKATGLAAGTYTVIITDTFGCSANTSVIITEPTKLASSITSVNVKCYGAYDGSATVTVSGGTSPYTYSWNSSPAQTTAQANNLPAGNSIVIVTDLKGCILKDTAAITEPTPITLSTMADSVSCFGGSNGSASVLASGGTLPYTYSWNTNPVQSTAQASDLAAGIYSILVKDFNGCIANASVTVYQPTELVLATASNPVKCFGGTDGSASVIVSGGTAGYTYSWNTSPVQTTALASGIAEGTYTVTVQDAKACTKTAIATITQPALLTATAVPGNVKCFGGTDGSIQATATGGTSNYTYSWNTNPVQTSVQATGLAAGTYSLTLTDANGCTATASATISEPPLLSASALPQAVKCHGGDDGIITATVTGGTIGYAYSWNTNPVQTNAQATALLAGSYTVTVTDAHGCTTTASATVIEPTPLILTTSTQDVKCHGANDGSATVNVSGGTQGYTYSWNTVPVQTSAQATSLIAGSYSVTVKDANSCMQLTTLSIQQPSPVLVSTSFTNPTCLQAGSATATISGGTSPYSHSWNSIPLQTSLTAVNLDAGNYSIIGTDANGCSFQASVVLVAPPMPVANFSFTTGCFGSTINAFSDGSSVAAGADASAITAWSWDFGNPSTGSDNVSSILNPTHSYDAAGVFTVRLIVTTNKGCKDTISKPVEVYPVPVALFSPFAQGCEPVCATFSDASTVSTGSINQWLWTFGDPSSVDNTSALQNPSHCFNKAGSYNVTLKVTTDHGCTASLTQNDLIKVFPAPVVNLGPEQKICTENKSEGPITFNAGPGTTYLWQPSGDTTQTINVANPGVYSVKVSNQHGCSTEASVSVREVCPPRLFIGNAFSPDNDGINDTYNVYGVHIGKFHMLIFNRWGEIIFESFDRTHYWDGIYLEEPMPIGTYAWVIIYEGDSKEYLGPYKLEGSVTVVR